MKKKAKTSASMNSSESNTVGSTIINAHADEIPAPTGDSLADSSIDNSAHENNQEPADTQEEADISSLDSITPSISASDEENDALEQQNGHRSSQLIDEQATEESVPLSTVADPADTITDQPETPADDVSQDTPSTSVGTRFIASEDLSTSPPTIPEEAEPTAINGDGRDKSGPYQSAAPALASARPKRKKKRGVILFVVILLISLLLPSILVVVEGISTYNLYNYAHEGVGHLFTVKDIFTGIRTHPTGFLDVNKLHLAQAEFTAAGRDFQQLNTRLQHDPGVGMVASLFPQQITSARALSRIGLDVTDMGQFLSQTALTLAPTFRGPLLADTSKPLVTPAMLTTVQTTIDYLLPRLSDIQRQAKSLELNSLPISAQQRQQLTQLLQAIPQAQADLVQGRALLEPVGWILGVNEPRTFLVQTMDRAELRPTGGFTGQFGELHIDGGRLAPFSLKNIGPYEENNPDSLVRGQLAPAPYTWWPIPNWGLRDSNLSADFPTSAQLAINMYKYEFAHQVDGVILFSPFLISHVLQITGPIHIPEYQETITAQNMEERLHYYQLDNVGIRKEELVEHVPDSPDAPTQARKLFTARLARLLMDHVRQAPPDELITIARELLYDLKTKDLQVYVNNPQIEALLAQYGAAGQMDRSTTHDGLYVVQANISANKASQYVSTMLHDTVNLDASGGATHTLQMRLVYNQIGPVYGLDTYRDYVRIYVPSSAKFRWGNGFDSGVPLCGGPYRACPQQDVYRDGTLLCPPGLTEAGYSTDMLYDDYLGRAHPIDEVGPPTNMSSDEAGRAMFGGWLVIPKNCTLTATLSWYVPPTGQTSYTLLVQRQSSTFPELDLTILPAVQCSSSGAAGQYFTGIMDGQDMTFTQPITHPTTHRSVCSAPSKV